MDLPNQKLGGGGEVWRDVLTRKIQVPSESKDNNEEESNKRRQGALYCDTSRSYRCCARQGLARLPLFVLRWYSNQQQLFLKEMALERTPSMA
ncbi:43 Kda Receptor-Associated Protein Of The Synapse [Manis pentadactyla]|nr:43 Kda Receptor-Associated Protein Of The Synapse [Manis pentadactyla]